MVILRIKSPFLFMQVALREWSCGFKVHYNLDIPILAAYKFNISDNTKFVINAGPYLAFGLGGKCKFDEGGDYKLFKGEDGEDAEYSRFDLGIQYGIGLEIGDHYLVNLTGQNGFISPFDYPDGYDGDKPKNMTFSIGVGYRF